MLISWAIAFDVLSKIETGSVKAIYAYHFLEHVSDLEKLLREFERVMTQGGEATLVVPHFSSPLFLFRTPHTRCFSGFTHFVISLNGTRL
jgi:ubiquinone/menaquinone biosynthesis C-methylase UbiE